MRKLRSDQSGATIIEFALVAPVFFLLLLGIIEFGMIGFSQVAIESAVSATAREASLGKGGPAMSDRVTYVKTHIKRKLRGLINVDELVVSASTVIGGGAVEPDVCLSSPPRIGGPCPPPLLWEDGNGNGVYDESVPTTSLGSAGDIVEVRAYYPWKIQLPFLNRFFGENGIFVMSSSTIIKNEPF